DALLAEAQAPGVVVGRAEEFHLRAVRLEAEEALAELVGLPADPEARGVVALHGPDPVIQAVLHVAGAAVRVAHVPGAEEHLAHVGLAVAVGVLEEDGLRRVEDDDAAASK